tara:strand:- start:2597 stop:3319 length:723 start_codon:yes stop_codon:yes gene_type:complete
MQEFSLRTESLKSLLLQRTKYQSKHKWLSYKPLYRLYEQYFLSIWEKNRQKEIARLFYEDIHNDYQQIASYLPEHVSSVVDVGSGLGGINIFLHERYRDQNPFFYLLDKDQIDRTIEYFYEQTSSAYCDFKATQNFLTDNGLLESEFALVDLNTTTFPKDIKVELVISLLSWGFHYPLETYLDDVLAILTEDGSLVIDLRKDQVGIVNIMEKFSTVQLVDETFRHVRVVAKRKNLALDLK